MLGVTHSIDLQCTYDWVLSLDLEVRSSSPLRLLLTSKSIELTWAYGHPIVWIFLFETAVETGVYVNDGMYTITPLGPSP